MKIRLTAFVFLFLGIGRHKAQVNYTHYVDPFIGTGGHGHTFPGAVLPFGMVQLSPDTRVDGSWDGCSGYHYKDTLIYGFSHTHLSGTGCSDWGDILVMPTLGSPSMNNKIYASPFSHATEKASPGFYEVVLSKTHIKAELTSTLRTGIHRYTFPAGAGKQALLVLDLLHRDNTLQCDVRLRDSVTVEGFRLSSAWAVKQRVFFVMRFSKPLKKIAFASDGQFKARIQPELNERAEGACFAFDLGQDSCLMVKVGISAVSTEGALRNLEVEAKHWNFETYRAEAEQAWNKQLQKIEINGTLSRLVKPPQLLKPQDKWQKLSPAAKVIKERENELTVFYTALYHCFIHPSLYMDVDGQYRGRDDQVHKAEGFVNYSVFSLWDTYRALNPLFTILEPARCNDFINSFLTQYRQAGRLPMWELSNNETDCMIGFHAVSVITDAMVKGVGNFDQALAYEAMKAASNYSAYGIPAFNKKGYLQVNDENESVSKSLEYGYDDWCIAQAARLLNKQEDEKLYLKRSLAYRDLFDSGTGFMRPRKNGDWLSPFYPAEVNNHFTEGNSWQYSFYVPQDVEGLIGLHGGRQKFEKKLDELFTTTEKNRGREQADVTGLIGQYAHGNEPSHHMAYLYNYVGQPQKTIERVNDICRNFYTNGPEGLIGNEDCGQMSAWYVFSVLGLYPVCPGQTQYVLASPRFESIRLNLENGKIFSISSAPLPGQVVSAVSINDTVGLRSAIAHASIAAGGKLNFLYDLPKTTNGYGKGTQVPLGVPNTETIMAAPLIHSSARIFKERAEISILPVNSGTGLCVYTLNGSIPSRSSSVYSKPFYIDSNCTVKARIYSNKDSSAVTEAVFYKSKNNYTVNLVSKPSGQYVAEGPSSLVDGVMGSIDWRKGDWLGFQGRDFECVLDLGEKKEIGFVNLYCLQDARAWILMPNRVDFYGSEDNKNFSLIATVENVVRTDDYRVQLRAMGKKLEKTVKLRYLKVVAENFGKLPDWHEGKGGDAFIFTDELELR